MRSFFVALQLLTRIPVRLAEAPSPAEQARAAGWYPLVGALVGGFAAVGYAACVHAGLAALGPFAALGAAVALTGAFHEDGLADTCDGLFGGADRARRLAIMRDSRIGTYGVVGLILVLGVEIQALALVPIARVPLLLIAAHAFARAAALPLTRLPYARQEEGLARPLARAISWPTLLGALGLGAAATCALSLSFAVGALALGAIVVACAAYCFARDLGGITGDALGATVKLVEVGCYVLGAALLR